MTRGWLARIGVATLLGLAVLAWSRWIPMGLDSWWPWPPLPIDSSTGRLADVLALVAGPVVTTGALLLVALWASRRRLYRLAGQLLIGALGSLALVTVLKVVVGRQRPETPWLGMLSADASYPSGHAAGATILLLGLVAVAAEARWSKRRRLWWMAVWVVVAVVIGIDRLLLGVHHTSDVLGGVLVSLFAHSVAVALTYSPARTSFVPAGRFAVVVNPTKVRDPGLLRRIIDDEAARLGWELVSWAQTTIDDAGASMTRAAVQAGAERVLVVGGDGTQRAACSVLAGGRGVLGLVAHGSGDLLARALGVPRDLPTAVHRALAGAPEPMDVLRVTVDGRPEISVAMVGLGADAAVLSDTSPTLKRWAGPFAYLVAGRRHLTARPVGSRVLVDDAAVFEGAASLVEVGNVAELRAGVALLPGASPTDGAAYVLVATPDGAGDVLRMIAGVLAGSTRDPQLARVQGTRVEVVAQEPVPCQIDGELMGDVRSVTCTVDPGAVRVAL